jgi:hypothetical protein
MNQPKDQETVNITINSNLLAKMLSDKSLYVADIRCLDNESKKQVWKLCLEASQQG